MGQAIKHKIETKKKRIFSRIVSVLACCAIAHLGSQPSFATQIYLEDGDSTQPAISNPNMPSIDQHRWPRVMMAETQSLTGGIEQYSKYQIIATQGGVLDKIADLQQAYPELMFFRMLNPYEYAGFPFDDDGITCTQSNGIPFNKTTSETGSCGVYAGHWLYRAGSKTTAAINKSTKTIRVQNASRFKVGEYVVVYDAPAGSFRNAEHMRVTSKSNSSNRLTVKRAYKSVAKNHPNSSIVAPHVLGQSRQNDSRNWVYNLTTQSPRDSRNRRLIDYLPNWLENNFNRNFRGDLSNVDVSGILFDLDSRFLSPKKSIDANNDLVVDDAISSSGVNWQEQGLNQFYASVRSRFPNMILSGGTRDAGGFADLNGVQMEGFPNQSNFHTPTPNYDNVSSLLARYSYQSRYRSTGPAHSHVLSKTPSKLYPFDANTRPSNNRAFRFALGMTMLEDGYFAFRNTRQFPDVWFDEYAVNLKPGAQFGHAIVSNKNNEAAARSNTGWLGRPKGPRKRIYSDNQFRPSSSIIKSGTFERTNDISEWNGRALTTSIVNTAQDGTKGLRASPHQGYRKVFSDAAIVGPKAQVVSGRQYTLAFSARATKPRDIGVAAGGHSERFLIGTTWKRFVMTFTASQSGLFRTNINLGRENTEVIIDSLYLFEGNPNVFRRDFDNGIVVVNATPSQTTVSERHI